MYERRTHESDQADGRVKNHETNEERTSQIKQMAGLRITSDMVVALSRALSLSLILVIGGAFNAGRI